MTVGKLFQIKHLFIFLHISMQQFTFSHIYVHPIQRITATDVNTFI